MKSVYIKYDIKYFLHNIWYWHKLRLCKAKKTNVLYFVFEPHRSHSGLADRLKAVISLYNLAKANGYDFKLYFKTPFALSDYLMPKYNWEMSLSDLEYSLLDTKIINETNWHKISTLKPNKQYHCYNYAGNDIPWQFEDTGYYWHELFQELFQPSMLSRNIILGHAPKELIDIVGYNPVIEYDYTKDSAMQVQNILNNIDAYQYLVDKNRESALKYGDWKKRIRIIYNKICLTQIR